MSALDTQVGGNHYREGGIQPIQYIEANSLQFLEASVVKRVTRHNRDTGKGRQDIEKAIHELQLLRELRYAATGGAVTEEHVFTRGEVASDYCLPSVKCTLPMPKCAPAKVDDILPEEPSRSLGTWHPWYGGTQPVANNQLVDVKFGEGGKRYALKAEDVNWTDTGSVTLWRRAIGIV